MEFKSWLGRAASYRPPLHVCLAYLLVCTMLATGLSFSRYAVADSDSDAAQVAAGALRVSGTSSARFDLDCNQSESPSQSYTFTVRNRDGGKTSQVAIEYDIVVGLSQALPDGVTMGLDNSSGSKSSNGKTYTFSGGTFAARTSSTQSQTLTITADADEVTGSSPYQLELTISVLAEQVD